jgi:hypothetical protein
MEPTPNQNHVEEEAEGAEKYPKPSRLPPRSPVKIQGFEIVVGRKAALRPAIAAALTEVLSSVVSICVNE